MPTFYAVSPDLVTQGNAVVTTEAATSGEAEAAFVVVDGEVYVTVCSDHTDRAAERLDIALSKRACHKVIGTSAWRLADLADRWDELELRSWIGEESTPYQEGRSARCCRRSSSSTRSRGASSRSPSSSCAARCRPSPESKPSPRFRAELFDPAAERSLEVDYAVAALDLLRLEPTDSVRLA